MPRKWGAPLARLLSTVSLAWCVIVGGWIWFTPFTCESIGSPGVGHRSFSEVSLFGPAPLIVPVLIAALAAWAAWRSHRVVLGIAAFLLAVFTFISGFSIGRGYVPASGLLVVAAMLAAFSGGGQRKSAAA